MTKEVLDSERVNYLVWRYLQESNYAQTAVKLQAEWNQPNPQSLDFARNVKDHALVSILQRGLLWHEAERRAAAKAQAQCDNAATVSGFFGPVGHLTSPPASDDEPMNIRKRSSEERPNQSRPASPAKRTKLSNGYENGIKDVTPMDLDHGSTSDAASQNGHVGSSPRERERTETPPPPPVTEGPDKYVQAGGKVLDLAKYSTSLSLKDEPKAESTSPVQPVLTHCVWSPSNRDLLATLGYGSVTRCWDLTKTKNVFGNAEPEQKLFDTPPNTRITAASWSPAGNILAVASDCLDTKSAKVELWDVIEAGWVMQYNPTVGPPIVCLRWNIGQDSDSNNSIRPSQLLLAVSAPVKPEYGRACLTIYDPPKQEIVTFEMPENFSPLEAQWLDIDVFAVSDEKSGMVFAYRNNKIEMIWQSKEALKEGETWSLSKSAFSPFWSHLAVADDKSVRFYGTHVEWKNLPSVHPPEEGQRIIQYRESSAVSVQQPCEITEIAWQPKSLDVKRYLTFHEDGIQSPHHPLLATGGVDGIVRLWRLDLTPSDPAKLPRPADLMYSLQMDSVIMGLAFTHDGKTLATASQTQVFVWDMDDLLSPKATFVNGSDKTLRSPSPGAKKVNGVEPKGEIVCLGWNATDEKLAYGVNGLVSVFDYKRLKDGAAT